MSTSSFSPSSLKSILSSRKGLVVIGAGLPRTGTDSLKEALQILLGYPCYHMHQLNRHGLQEARMWCTDSPDFNALFDNRLDGVEYRAGVDFPLSAFAEELMDRYPDALVILSKRRNAAEWAKSIEETICKTSKLLRMVNRLTLNLLPSFSVLRTMIPKLWIRAIGMEASQFTRERLVEAYEKYNARIEKIVPKERLLIYTVGDGWEPLCKALNVPVPSMAYPNRNSSAEFQKEKISGGKQRLRNECMSWRGLVIVSVYAAAGCALYLGGNYLANMF